MTTPSLQACALELDSVSIRYENTTVVRDVSFVVGEGEFVTLLGPSGSGKTSLLRAIAGFVKPATGRVLLGGEVINDTPPYGRDVGMVFQSYALFPHMTVRRNLEFGLQMNHVPRAEREARVADTLEYVRLSGFEERYPDELSGGQQQRVAIARALAIQPRILLLDEPMSNLDARLRSHMRGELMDILERIGVTTVAVTHNQEEALSMSDRVIVMAAGEIRQIGTPSEIYEQPADSFVADFVGDANIVRGQVIERNGRCTQVMTEWGFPVRVDCHHGDRGDAVVLLLRPELVEIAPGPRDGHNAIEATVAQVAYMGGHLEIRCAAGPAQLLVKGRGGADRVAPSVGDTVTLVWDPAGMVLLAER
ncbi:MAG: ABC transporter ATP-binding protein [Arenicellales bacterium]